jgi:hypothetical protein
MQLRHAARTRSILTALVCLAVACGDPEDDGLDHGATELDHLSQAATVPMVTRTFSRSSADMPNPERGYYTRIDLLSPKAQAIRDAGFTLAFAKVRLDDYRYSSIDSAFLTKLRAGFAACRAAGIKVILRFTYNSGYTGDASKSRILGHLKQLEPLLAENADVIAVMQAGFIGAYGEWHSSTNGLDNDADRATILKAILAALPSSRFVQVRTPMKKEGALPGGPLEDDEAYRTSNLRARVGHHNDCFLATSSDYGTYARPYNTWRGYVAQDAQYTPAGGETCKVNAPRTDCEQAIDEMELLSWSYLNKHYNADVLSRWESQGCGSTIRRNLGYRLWTPSATYNKSVAPGGELHLTVKIENRGFAAPFNRRPVYVVMRRGSTQYTARLSGSDARRFGPGSHTIATRLRIPATAATGDWELALWMPDHASAIRKDPRYAIRLANSSSYWDAKAGLNILTSSLKVDASAAGPVSSSATTFAEL